MHINLRLVRNRAIRHEMGRQYLEWHAGRNDLTRDEAQWVIGLYNEWLETLGSQCARGAFVNCADEMRHALVNLYPIAAHGDGDESEVVVQSVLSAVANANGHIDAEEVADILTQKLDAGEIVGQEAASDIERLSNWSYVSKNYIIPLLRQCNNPQDCTRDLAAILNQFRDIYLSSAPLLKHTVNLLLLFREKFDGAAIADLLHHNIFAVRGEEADYGPIDLLRQ